MTTGGTAGAVGGDDGAVVVDARGLRCPLPVIRLAAAARERGAGDLLTVWSTDPAARLDVPAWARMRGHRVVEERELPGSPAAWAVTVALGA
ncbi:sulfurtransferase TusA family protein [Cellulosimicrobium sp. Marseille-Q8652]